MADYKTEFEDLRLLGVDISSLEELQAQVDQLEARLSEAKAESLALRPGSKDFDSKLLVVTNRTIAYTAQLEAAQKDVANKLEAVKRKVISELGDYIDKNWQEVRALDAAVVKCFLDARNAIISRQEATQKMDAKVSVLDRYCNELQNTNGVRTSRTPWLADFPGNWQAAFKIYVDRFMKIAGSSLEAPQGEDVESIVSWFGKRY